MEKRQKFGGRRKGTPNKTTSAVKTALTKAFEDSGGVEGLVAWAKDNPTEFYKLWAKLLPVELHLAGKDGGPVQVIGFEVVMPNGEDDERPDGADSSGEAPPELPPGSAPGVEE